MKYKVINAYEILAKEVEQEINKLWENGYKVISTAGHYILLEKVKEKPISASEKLKLKEQNRWKCRQ